MAEKSSQAQALMATTRSTTVATPQRQGYSPLFEGYNRWATMYGSSLPRSFDTFRSGDFSPFEPILPNPIDLPEQPSGRPRPRRWQFPVGWNLPVGQPGTEGVKLANFQVLRDLADVGSIPRRAVEVCKADLLNLDWGIVPTDDAEKAMQGNPAKRKDFDSRKAELWSWFMYEIDPGLYYDFHSWLNAALEDLIVLDAMAIHILPSKGKNSGPMGSNIGGFEIIDGSSIRPMLNTYGGKPRPPEVAYQQCFTPDTEVLTRGGWMKFTDLSLDHELATRSPSGELEWQQPQHIISQPYEGEMLRFHNRTLDLMVTPDHRMLVDHRPRALGGTGNRWDSEGECLIPAGELAKAYGQPGRSEKSKEHSGAFAQARFTACATWKGDDLDTFAVPSFVQNTGKGSRFTLGPTEISGDDLAAFMGMYLAEGNCTHVRGVLKSDIAIAQLEKSKGYEKYEALLSRLTNGRLRYNGSQFHFAAYGLATWLDQFGLSHDKFIPDEIMEMSARQLRIFWDYYALGDGSSRDGSIVTVSKRMADQLQEVALKIGIAASVRPY